MASGTAQITQIDPGCGPFSGGLSIAGTGQIGSALQCTMAPPSVVAPLLILNASPLDARVPVLGCSLRVLPTWSWYPSAANPQVSIVVPSSTALVGSNAYFQAVLLHPLTSLTTSNTLRVTFAR